MGLNWRKAMMKMKTNTKDMLVVAKNSTVPFNAGGRLGNIISKEPEPMTDWMMPSNKDANTVPNKFPTPPNTITMKQETI